MSNVPLLPWTVQTGRVEDTIALGRRLGERLASGLIICLSGPLGAGKTHFVKGVALGNGLEDARDVTSPTFVLIQEYPGRVRLFHLDVYRLSNPKSVLGLGLGELTDEGCSAVVEWAEKFSNLWPEDRLEVAITPGTEPDARRFEFRATGPIAVKLLNEFVDQHLKSQVSVRPQRE